MSVAADIFFGVLCVNYNVLTLLLLLIPQSFDWLAAFHLDLLQVILFIAG